MNVLGLPGKNTLPTLPVLSRCHNELPVHDLFEGSQWWSWGLTDVHFPLSLECSHKSKWLQPAIGLLVFLWYKNSSKMKVCLGAPTAEVILCYVKWQSWVLIWWWHKALAKHLRGMCQWKKKDGRRLIMIPLSHNSWTGSQKDFATMVCWG